MKSIWLAGVLPSVPKYQGPPLLLNSAMMSGSGERSRLAAALAMAIGCQARWTPLR